MPAPTLATLIAESPLDDVLEAIEATARRPDVIAVMNERAVAAENYLRRIFGEAPVPPRTGPLRELVLRAGLPQCEAEKRPPGVLIVERLDEIIALLKEWRERDHQEASR